jgi:tetratricopeptide (TPR) repeat protein
VSLKEFEAALDPPPNLGEAKHPLANRSNLYFWLGEACDRLGRVEEARAWWMSATQERRDFQQMAVREVSDMTFWSALALRRLGKMRAADELFRKIEEHSVHLEQTEPEIDYFATSLPAMLLFEDDLARRNRIDALFLRAQATYGLRGVAESERMLFELLQLDRSHCGASDLMRIFEDSTETAKVL